MALLWCNGLVFLGCSHVANALLHFSKAPCFVQLRVWSRCCLQGCSPAPLSRMLCEKHSVTPRRGHPEPPIAKALRSCPQDEGHWSGGTRWLSCTWLCPCPGHTVCCSTSTWHGAGASLGHRCLGQSRDADPRVGADPMHTVHRPTQPGLRLAGIFYTNT